MRPAVAHVFTLLTALAPVVEATVLRANFTDMDTGGSPVEGSEHWWFCWFWSVHVCENGTKCCCKRGMWYDFEKEKCQPGGAVGTGTIKVPGGETSAKTAKAKAKEAAQEMTSTTTSTTTLPSTTTMKLTTRVTTPPTLLPAPPGPAAVEEPEVKVPIEPTPPPVPRKVPSADHAAMMP
mmetsp:Transcript_69280/g.150798  ORF Transcript_69280/g.150798 Transcript_69280/m.150798 type:complete len:179 (+) Transcript_69280:45-581(+)